MKNIHTNDQTKQNFESFHQDLERILKETERLNDHLPSGKLREATLDKKVKEAIDVNLLSIWEKKEIAEAKVSQLEKQLSAKIEKVKQLEYQNYILQKQRKEEKLEFSKMKDELQKKSQDVEKLLDILYGTDKAKEYAKLDSENWSSKQIRAYHIGPPTHVARSMYGKNEGIVGLRKNEPNYWADGHNEIWKTQEENLVKKEEEQDSLEQLAKNGLWVLNNEKQRVGSGQVPIADQIKNHYNTMMFRQNNPDSTLDTDMFAREGSAGGNSGQDEPHTPGFQNTHSRSQAHLPSANMPQGADQTQLSKSGFRLTFN